MSGHSPVVKGAEFEFVVSDSAPLLRTIRQLVERFEFGVEKLEVGHWLEHPCECLLLQ